MSQQEHESRTGEILQQRYQLVEFLARGGMGAVFLCQDLRLPGQRWALKEMLVANPHEARAVEESFRREARILADLKHPGLPAIVDTFAEGERHYLVMDFVPGQTLARRIEQGGPAPFRQVLDWGLQLAEVVGYLHAQQPPVIFRDLKPENVMLTPDGRVQLVDFGLARHYQPGKQRDTQAAASVGYSAPEQWADQEQSDERSDIYGLGACLYFMLCGRAPSPHYGKQNLRKHCPEIDPRMEALVLRCLRPHPADRFADCSALEENLRQLTPRSRARTSRLKGLAWIPAMILLLGLGLSWSRGTAPPGPNLELKDLLLHTAASKQLTRQWLAAGKSEEAMVELEALLETYPQDGEAQILHNNLLLETPQKALTIPVFTSISGNEYEGIQMLSGLALAQWEINQAGGVVDALQPQLGPRSVRLEVFDCQSRQDLTLEGYLQASRDPHCHVALGPWSSQQLIAVAPIVEPAGLPTLAPTASDVRTSQMGPNCFTVADSDVGRVGALASHLRRRHLSRALILRNQGNVVGHSASASFGRCFGEQGGQLVGEFDYQQETQDFNPLLDQIHSLGMDCIFLAEYRAEAVMALTRSLRHRGITCPVASLVSLSPHWSFAPDTRSDGLLLATYFSALQTEPGVRDFCSRFGAFAGGALPSHREAYSYDALQLLSRAIEEVGFERKAIREYLLSLGDRRPPYAGVSGRFVPSRTKEFRHPTLLEVREGQLQVLSQELTREGYRWRPNATSVKPATPSPGGSRVAVCP